ncbi:sugar efflux transporter [Aliivibrio fischeri]|uniref:sugar efflux transporter n=1 Tax=Aliivibrio fischeri TaxID=668 RepID=UPI0007C447B2|nr:sugar efflux transporter [Aliivibrio fischeri]MCE7555298.1 sugar efflux transporter [Aliivibrio fischeri]MCE7562566.1 sugar efflux transporter [Aliivibrio fischeri]MCE7569974.1 sugar efflux transporter [Aliivibrio fischeri]
MYKDKTSLLFIFTAFITGLCSAFFYPLSSLFIVEELDASPMMLSLYMTLAVSSSVIVSQFIAKRSDTHWNRKTILMISLASYLILVASFTVIRDYWLAITMAVVFGSVSGASFGQLFALGREYGDRHVANSTSFLATMRAGLAIAWVFGPPAAFMLKAQFGFSAAFAVSAITVSVAILIIAKLIPDNVVTKEERTAAITEHKPLGRMVILYCFIIVCAFSANNLYITSMPLYLSQELQVDVSWLGLMFGVAAACEIPVMLGAGKMAEKMGTTRVMTLGVISGAMFFLVMLSSTSFTSMLIAQILNGFFIGVCATLGMVALQDMMKDRLGTASTLFSNMLNISVLVSSVLVGVVGELYNYYSALYLCFIGAIIAAALLIVFEVLEKKQKIKIEGQCEMVG